MIVKMTTKKEKEKLEFRGRRSNEYESDNDSGKNMKATFIYPLWRFDYEYVLVHAALKLMKACVTLFLQRK